MYGTNPFAGSSSATHPGEPTGDQWKPSTPRGTQQSNTHMNSGMRAGNDLRGALGGFDKTPATAREVHSSSSGTRPTVLERNPFEAPGDAAGGKNVGSHAGPSIIPSFSQALGPLPRGDVSSGSRPWPPVSSTLSPRQTASGTQPVPSRPPHSGGPPAPSTSVNSNSHINGSSNSAGSAPRFDSHVPARFPPSAASQSVGRVFPSVDRAGHMDLHRAASSDLTPRERIQALLAQREASRQNSATNPAPAGLPPSSTATGKTTSLPSAFDSSPATSTRRRSELLSSIFNKEPPAFLRSSVPGVSQRSNSNTMVGSRPQSRGGTPVQRVFAGEPVPSSASQSTSGFSHPPPPPPSKGTNEAGETSRPPSYATMGTERGMFGTSPAPSATQQDCTDAAQNSGALKHSSQGAPPPSFPFRPQPRQEWAQGTNSLLRERSNQVSGHDALSALGTPSFMSRMHNEKSVAQEAPHFQVNGSNADNTVDEDGSHDATAPAAAPPPRSDESAAPDGRPRNFSLRGPPPPPPRQPRQDRPPTQVDELQPHPRVPGVGGLPERGAIAEEDGSINGAALLPEKKVHDSALMTPRAGPPPPRMQPQYSGAGGPHSLIQNPFLNQAATNTNTNSQTGTPLAQQPEGMTATRRLYASPFVPTGAQEDSPLPHPPTTRPLLVNSPNPFAQEEGEGDLEHHNGESFQHRDDDCEENAQPNQQRGHATNNTLRYSLPGDDNTDEEHGENNGVGKSDSSTHPASHLQLHPAQPNSPSTDDKDDEDEGNFGFGCHSDDEPPAQFGFTVGEKEEEEAEEESVSVSKVNPFAAPTPPPIVQPERKDHEQPQVRPPTVKKPRATCFATFIPGGRIVCFFNAPTSPVGGSARGAMVQHNTLEVLSMETPQNGVTTTEAGRKVAATVAALPAQAVTPVEKAEDLLECLNRMPNVVPLLKKLVGLLLSDEPFEWSKGGKQILVDLVRDECSRIMADGVPRGPQLSGGAVKGNEEALNEVQRLVVLGKRDEAVECAIANKLHLHALLISVMCSTKDFYLRTIEAVVNEAIDSDSPLATAYRLFNNLPVPPPSATKPANDSTSHNTAQSSSSEWLFQVSTILSNFTRNSTDALMTWGDTLMREGRMQEAHCCFLIVQLSPAARVAAGSTPPPPQQALLNRLRGLSTVLGGCYDRTRGRSSFINLDSVFLTELQEYSRRRENPQNVHVPLFAFRVMAAHMLHEVGATARASAYIDCVRAMLPPSQLAGSPIVVPRSLVQAMHIARAEFGLEKGAVDTSVQGDGTGESRDRRSAPDGSLAIDANRQPRTVDAPQAEQPLRPVEGNPTTQEARANGEMGSFGEENGSEDTQEGRRSDPRSNSSSQVHQKSMPPPPQQQPPQQQQAPPPPQQQQKSMPPPPQQQQQKSMPPPPQQQPPQQQQQQVPPPPPQQQQKSMPPPPQQQQQKSMPPPPQQQQQAPPPPQQPQQQQQEAPPQQKQEQQEQPPAPQRGRARASSSAAAPSADGSAGSPSSDKKGDEVEKPRRSRSLEAITNFFSFGRSNKKVDQVKPAIINTAPPPVYDPVTRRYMFPMSEEEKKVKEMIASGPPRREVAPSQAPPNGAPSAEGPQSPPSKGMPAPAMGKGMPGPPGRPAANTRGYSRPQYVDSFNTS